MIFNPIVPKMESTTYISSLAVGSSVWCKVNGTRTEFIVVNQGNPDTSLYDTSCDGTWVLMKDMHSSRQWNTSNTNTYQNSAINTWLNNDFLEMLDTGVKAAIKQVKIPYCLGNGAGNVFSGTTGLSTKGFLLSGYEVGWTTSDNQHFPQDGAKLSYFVSGTGTSANNKRIAKLNGSASYWWLRSSYIGETASAWGVSSDGYLYNGGVSNSRGIRPAFILPFDTKIDKDNNIIAPPVEPETWVINENAQIFAGHTFNLSFTSNQQSFGKIVFGEETKFHAYLYYGDIEVADASGSNWYVFDNAAYRTITFDQPVTDANLLTWLQANAVKQ